jgi:uncharacterized protein
MAVQFNVATLLREPVGSTRSYDVDDMAAVPENGAVRREHVTGHADLLRTKDGVLVRARLRSDQHERCARCLRDLELELPFEIEEEFYPIVDILTGVKVEPPDAHGAFRIDDRHILDLSEAIRQYSMMTAPMAPLCRADCRGLCPRCGRDWNEGPCDCEPEPDERWSALAELLEKPERG